MKTVTGKEKLQEQEKQLSKEVEERELSGELPTANIMVAGITGAGKSTLVNAVFGSGLAETGVGRPVTDRISEYQTEDIPVHIWDTVGLELDSEKTRESINSIKATIASKASAADLFDRIHAIWYCVGAPSKRYQGPEWDFVKELHSLGVPFIIVLTQCHEDEGVIDIFEAKIHEENEKMGIDDIPVIRVLAEPLKYKGGYTVEAFGLIDLVNKTMELLPEFIKSSFIAAQRVSVLEKRAECEKSIWRTVEEAKNGFWDKVPIINWVTTQIKIESLFKRISRVYNTVLPDESVTKITKECGVGLDDCFFGLVNPFDWGYGKEVANLLEKFKSEGSTDVKTIDNRNRAARMIAFFGYTFIEAIEELWNGFSEEQLKNVDTVVRQLTGIINDKLKAANAIIKKQ